MFIFKNCWGTPSPLGRGVASLGHSLARVKTWAGAPLMGRNMVFRKSLFGWVRVHLDNGVGIVDQSSPDFFSSSAAGIAGDHVSFRFWISPSVPEIFAIEVWSYPKSTKILHVFGPNFFGEKPPMFWDLYYKNGRTFRSRGKVSRRSADAARRFREENKKAQLTQRERATAVHLLRPTANKCKIRKNLYSSAQGHSRSLLSVSIETRVWLPISD